MSSPFTVDLFVEDTAHEELLRPLIERLATDEGVSVRVRTRSARGGHGRALQEYRIYQRLVIANAVPDPLPDLIVVGIDGNCTTAAKKRKEIEEATDQSLLGRMVSACPDPHVERWYLADPDSFHAIVGYRPTVGRKKCARDHYKRLLSDAVRNAGHPPTLGGIEFAGEIAQGLDWYRAGKADGSFGSFVEDLRKGLRVLAPKDPRRHAGGTGA